jgi:hypothetical protein
MNMRLPHPKTQLALFPLALLLGPMGTAHACPQDLLDFLEDGAYMRPDEEPPIGVMGAAMAAAGRMTVAWTWAGANHSNPRIGNKEATTGEVTDQGYASAATSARIEEHRFTFHFELNEGLDVELTLPYRDSRADVLGPLGKTRMRTNGLGDVEIGALWNSARTEGDTHSYGLGLGLPTGSTNSTGNNPGSGDGRLPYSLQPGSGAWSLIPRAHWLGQTEDWSWGYGGQYLLRLREGGTSWNKGNELELSAWAAHRINRDMSISLRLDGHHSRGISGSESTIDPLASNLHDPDNAGGTLFRLFGGLNFVGTSGNRFAAEIGVPLYDDVDGVQLGTVITYGLGWRYSF